MSGGRGLLVVCALWLGMAVQAADLRGVRTLIDQGKYTEAEQAALALVKQLEPDGSRARQLAEAIDLVLEARRAGRRLSTAGSVDLGERALRIKEAAFGPDDQRVAATLILLGLARAAARSSPHGPTAPGNHDAALADIQRGLAIRERAGPERLEMATAWSALATVRQAQRQWPLVVEAADRALAIARAVEQPPGFETARALATLAFAARAQNDPERAARFYEEALEIDERRLGPDHPALANLLSNFGGVLREIGEPDRARSTQERIVRLLERTPGTASQLAFELIELSTIVDERGDYSSALAIAERAVALAERHMGPRSTMTAAAMGFQAALLGRLGDHAGAAVVRQRVVELWFAAQGPESLHGALALNGLAIAYEQAGRLDEAMEAVERSLANVAHQKQPQDYVRALQTKARLLAALGRRAEARTLLERARDMAVNSPLFVARAGVGEALTELARVERADGRPARAVELFREAIALFERELGPYNIRTARRRVELAAALAEIGALDEARAALLEGEAGTVDHLRLMSRTLSDRRALAFAAERQSGLDLAVTLATARKTPSPADTAFAWEMLIHGRTVVLDEMAARQRTVIAEADRPGVRERWFALNRARTRLANAMLQGPQGQSAEEYRALVERARTARDQAERALAEASLAFRAEQDRTRAGAKEVLAQLQPGAALVGFVRYTPSALSHTPGAPKSMAGATSQAQATRPGTDVFAPGPRPAAYAAFVARPGLAPRVVPLGSAETIEAAIANWREGIQAELRSGGLASRRTETIYREAGAALRALVWDPVAAHLQPATSIFIVPDGAVHLVEFATLPTGRAGYLVDTVTPHYLLAERDLVRPQPEPGGHSLLAVGAPDFDKADRTAAGSATPPWQMTRDETSSLSADASAQVSPIGTGKFAFRGTPTGCEEIAARRFAPLPATRDELRQITDLWRRGPGTPNIASSRAAAGGGAPGQASGRDDVVLLGDDRATETAFKALAPGRRVLHVATHGFFLDRSCGASGAVPSTRGADTNTNVGTDAFDRRRLLSESPLLRSGLVLAGANRQAPSLSEEDDGILTAEEIAGLDLSAAQWAVLSACDTGRGDWQAGEGILGLRRAFQVAGARTVILSLWPVIDQVASHWMAELYRGRFVQGVSTSQAARAASQRLLAERRAAKQSTHPVYWSGFIATGDWR